MAPNEAPSNGTFQRGGGFGDSGGKYLKLTDLNLEKNNGIFSHFKFALSKVWILRESFIFCYSNKIIFYLKTLYNIKFEI
tara:strand:- start:1137 stop:1376 length:240 start_codon:yes stop_codon:yes gene_type:complete